MTDEKTTEKLKTNKSSLVIAGALGAAMLYGIATIDEWGPTDIEGATRTLNDQGYEIVDVGRYNDRGCLRGEWIRTAFTAKTPEGKTVNGTVCKVPFGGQQSIRFQ